VLAAGADPTVTTAIDTKSVLQLTDDVTVLNRLMQLGLPLEQRDSAGCTPLLEACACKFVSRDCVEALLAAGADICATDGNGWSVLHWLICSDTGSEGSCCTEEALEVSSCWLTTATQVDAPSTSTHATTTDAPPHVCCPAW